MAMLRRCDLCTCAMSNHITLFLVFAIGINISAAQTDPSNIACSAVNSTTLQLTWNQATDVSVQGYFLHIERVDGIRIEQDIPSVDLNLKTYDNYNFYGLGQYGTYNITIHSYTSVANLTNYVTTCTTAEDIPNSAPQTFYCTGISTSSISCTWNVLDQVYWNGVSLGFRLQWLSSNTSLLYETTVSANTTTNLVTGLSFRTLYYFMLNPYTSVGQGTMYSTTSASTLGFPEQEVGVISLARRGSVSYLANEMPAFKNMLTWIIQRESETEKKSKENVTRYYCNEAVPGVLVFGWEEMPCTIYTGTISAMFVICGLFIGIICCMSCCSKAASNNVSLNFMETSNGKRRRHRDYDDSDDSDSDDDNHKKMTDDEDIDEYDDDGYENKGYRSDEDPRSPESRKSDSPDGEMNSQGGTPDIAPSRQSETMDGPETKKMELERQLTARDVELEAISENEDAGSDSDYDTQSDNDYYNDSEENEGIETEASIVPVLAGKKGKAKTTKNIKPINAKVGAANSTARLSKAADKKAIATVAVIHTKSKSNERIAQMKEEESCTLRDSVNSPLVQLRQMRSKNKTLSRGKDESGNMTPENDWDDATEGEYHVDKGGKVMKDTPSKTASKHLPINKTTFKTSKTVVTTDDDWGTDFGNPSNSTIEKAEGKTAPKGSTNMPVNRLVTMTITEDDDWDEDFGGPSYTDRKTVPNRHSKSRKGEHVAITTIEENDWDSDTTEEPYLKKFNKKMDINSKINKSHSLPQNNRQKSTRKNEYELKSFDSASDQKYKQNDKMKSSTEELIEDDEWGSNLNLGHMKGKPAVSNKATHFGKMPNKSQTAVLPSIDNQIENHDNMKNHRINKHMGIHTARNEIDENKETGLTSTSKAPSIGQHRNASPNKVNERKQKMALQTTGKNNPQTAVNQNKNQINVVRKTQTESKKISFRDQLTSAETHDNSISKTVHKNMFFIEDEINDVKLQNDSIKRPESEPRGKRISTKAWLPQSNNNITKSGRKTPVKAFPKVQSWTAIEIEPVIDSDRLGKKFPFLSIDNMNSEKTNQKDAASSNHVRKNVSDSELIKASNIIHDDPGDQSVPKRKSEGDVLSKLTKSKSEPKDKIFYGFGAGRFRNIAAEWIGKFRSKKNPVKTVNTAW